MNAVLRIRDVYPGSRVKKIPDPHQRIKNLSIFDPKKALENMNIPDLEPRFQILIFYPSRIQGSKRHRIPDPDPQHCLNV